MKNEFDDLVEPKYILEEAINHFGCSYEPSNILLPDGTYLCAKPDEAEKYIVDLGMSDGFDCPGCPSLVYSGCITCSDGSKPNVVLTSMKLNQSQLEALLDWVYKFFNKNPDMSVVDSDGKSWTANSADEFAEKLSQLELNKPEEETFDCFDYRPNIFDLILEDYGNYLERNPQMEEKKLTIKESVNNDMREYFTKISGINCKDLTRDNLDDWYVRRVANQFNRCYDNVVETLTEGAE